MSLADVIDDFAADTPGPNDDGSYTVTRTAAGARVNGRYVAGSTSTFTIVASRTPPSGKDLEVLEQGQITTQSYVLITATELLTRTPASEPDTVDVEGDGVGWAVYEVDDYPDFDGGTFYRCLVARQAQT